MMDLKTYIRTLVPDENPVLEVGKASAPANMALYKYWGKQDSLFNLPTTPSLSVSLGDRGSHVKLPRAENNSLCMNSQFMNDDSGPFMRTFAFLELFLAHTIKIAVESYDTIPTAAGVASSASYFAALTLALNELCKWHFLSLPFHV